ncbi:glycosyltransferase [Porticoccaceae bacterium]|nr:glycosyltransferase [Porticoccaceae bacterium]
MKRKIAILHTMALGSKSGVGGVQKVIISSAKALSEIGSVEIIQHHDNEGISSNAFSEKLKVRNIKFEIPTLNNDYGGTNIVLLFIRIIKILASAVHLKWTQRRWKYDIIIGHDITTLFFMHLFPAKKRILMLHTERFFFSKTAKFMIKFWPWSKSVIYISPSKNIKQAIEKTLPGCSSHTVPTPVFETVKMQITNNEFKDKTAAYTKYHKSSLGLPEVKICYVGRFSPMKNLIDTIRFIDQLNKLGLDVSLDIYGEPFNEEQLIYKKDVEYAIENSNKIEAFTLCGLTKDPISTFKKYDFSIILSDGEAIALAGLESFIAGTPVIGYDVGGIDELVGANSRGVLFGKGQLDDGKAKFEEFLKNFDSTDVYKSMNQYVNLFTNHSFVKRICELVEHER